MTQTPHTSNSILLIGLILRRSAALRPSPTLQSVATVCGPPGLSGLHWSGAAVPGPSGGWGWGGTGVERSWPGPAVPDPSAAERQGSPGPGGAAGPPDQGAVEQPGPPRRPLCLERDKRTAAERSALLPRGPGWTRGRRICGPGHVSLGTHFMTRRLANCTKS